MAQADPSPKICRNNEKSGPEKAHDVAMKDLASTSQDQVVVDMAQADSSPRNNTAILVQQIPELGELRELMTSLNEKVDVIAETIQTSKDKGRGPMEIDGRQIANSHGCYVYNHCSFQTPRHSASHTLDEETDLKKEIVHVLECDATFYKDHSESSWDGAYPIRHSSPKAHVLILNNYEGFKAGHERKGAKVDGELMKQLWEGFQCEVEVQENHTAKAMWNSLIKFSRSDKHKSCDFCVVIIMSHGNSTDRGHDYFSGIDNATIENDEVVKLFKNSKDRLHLIGKPKLIFFQSCRGASAVKEWLYLLLQT
nr:caspase-2 [Ciona intestinalis]|eukprot:XP_004227431.2 caspase-2 [Ciona intestinalis]